MKKLPLAALPLMLLATAQPTAAAPFFMNSELLLSLCTSTQIKEQAECVGYIEGVSDMRALSKAWGLKLDKTDFELPPGTSQGDVMKSVVKFLTYLKERGELKGEAASQVFIALSADYPTKKTNKADKEN